MKELQEKLSKEVQEVGSKIYEEAAKANPNPEGQTAQPGQEADPSGKEREAQGATAEQPDQTENVVDGDEPPKDQ